jgi:fatty acid desaturase
LLVGDKNKDPELENSWLDPTLDSFASYLLYLSGIPFWISRFSTLIRHSLGNRYISEHYIKTEEKKLGIVREARYFLFFYVGVVCSLGALSKELKTIVLLCWILPSILGQPCLRYYLLAEHTGCKERTTMHENTRTTLTNFLYKRLAWNMNFHSEHHSWPQIPFHILPHVFELTNKLSIEQSGCDPNGREGYSSVHFKLIDRLLKK